MTLYETLPIRETQVYFHHQIPLKCIPELVFSTSLQAKACLACVLISLCLKGAP